MVAAAYNNTICDVNKHKGYEIIWHNNIKKLMNLQNNNIKCTCCDLVDD